MCSLNATEYYRPIFATLGLKGKVLRVEGENAKVVSERLDHLMIVLTLDTYTHVLPMQHEATERIEKILFKTAS